MSVDVLTAKSEPLAYELYEGLEEAELTARIRTAKEQLGEELLILGHHYQQDEVIQFADLTGDSFKLSRLAAAHGGCRWIVFCGVHFMAETADILANQKHRAEPQGHRRVTVILPDLAAGCSMADMADIAQVQRCWHELAELIDVAELMPVTYVNSTAALKAFCGRHGGIVCTSSNARAVLEWSFAQRQRVLFFPDQHLGRNTAKRMGLPLDQMIVWDPRWPLGDNDPERIKRAKLILWQGYCSVHQMFLPQHVQMFRQKFPDIKNLVHDGGGGPGRSGRVHRVHHQGCSGRQAWHSLGYRHGAASGEPVEEAASGAGDILPVADGLHVRDDVPYRPAPFVLVAGEPRARHCGKCHCCAGPRGPLGPGRFGAHAASNLTRLEPVAGGGPVCRAGPGSTVCANERSHSAGAIRLSRCSQQMDVGGA